MGLGCARWCQSGSSHTKQKHWSGWHLERCGGGTKRSKVKKKTGADLHWTGSWCKSKEAAGKIMQDLQGCPVDTIKYGVTCKQNYNRKIEKHSQICKDAWSNFEPYCLRSKERSLTNTSVPDKMGVESNPRTSKKNNLQFARDAICCWLFK